MAQCRRAVGPAEPWASGGRPSWGCAFDFVFFVKLYELQLLACARPIRPTPLVRRRTSLQPYTDQEKARCVPRCMHHADPPCSWYDTHRARLAKSKTARPTGAPHTPQSTVRVRGYTSHPYSFSYLAFPGGILPNRTYRWYVNGRTPVLTFAATGDS